MYAGRQMCSVRVPDATLDMTDPCNQDLKSYLDVSFRCVPGIIIIIVVIINCTIDILTELCVFKFF